MAKKILYIAYNGLTAEVQEYLKEINKKRIDMSVIVPYELDLYGLWINYKTAPKTDNVKYITFELKEPPYVFFPNSRNNEKLDSVLKKIQPDLIIIQSELFHPNSIAVINSKMQHSPNSKIMNFVASQYLPDFWRYLKNYFQYKKIIKNTDFLSCRNKKELGKLKKTKLLKGIKIFQNYWGSSLDLFYKLNKERSAIVRSSEKLKALSNILDNDNVILGFVGRITEEKGLHLIISALRNLPENYYLVYSGQFGSEVYGKLIDDKIKEYGLEDRCFYAGIFNYEELANFYNVLDLAIVPTNSGTIDFVELFGRVIPESMLCKVLVIGSDSGSIPEIIHNKRLVFWQNDADSLKDKIMEIIGLSRGEKNKIIEDNYNYALENYTSKKYAEKLQNFILHNT